MRAFFLKIRDAWRALDRAVTLKVYMETGAYRSDLWRLALAPPGPERDQAASDINRRLGGAWP
jgi:hypothetical protein